MRPEEARRERELCANAGVGGPAQAAGVQKGERIVEVNGVPVADKAALFEELKKLKALYSIPCIEFCLAPAETAPDTGKARRESSGQQFTATAAPAEKLMAENEGGDAGKGAEFGEVHDDHFVLTADTTTLHDGQYRSLEPLGQGTFARVLSAVDANPANGRSEKVHFPFTS